jgi:colanic acid/amylovoran biosynthesis protein
MMFAHGGSLNRGCEAIVRSSTSLLKNEIRGVKVFLASEKPETDRIITNLDGIIDGSKSTIKKYSYDWWLSSIKFKLFKDESYAIGKIEKNIIRHIKDMDIYLSIGGDNYCYGEQPGWYEIDKRVKAQGRKLVLWGCSIGEEDLTDRKLEDLKLFDLILARETLTFELLKSKGLSNVKLCADSAFTLETEDVVLPKGWQEGNTMGLNFSPLVWKKNKESFAAVKELIMHILETTDQTIALTPHVTIEGNNDYETLSVFYKEFKGSKRVIILPDHLTASQYKGYISKMRFFIGARTHATIAAYSSCVPTMVLGYSVKSKGISKDLFGDEKFVMDLKELSDSEKLKSNFNKLVMEEDVIRKKLQNSIPNIKRMSNKAVEYLKELK